MASTLRDLLEREDRAMLTLAYALMANQRHPREAERLDLDADPAVSAAYQVFAEAVDARESLGGEA